MAPRHHPAEVRDEQLRRAGQMRTATAVAATALTVTLALTAGATLPGRTTAAPVTQTAPQSGDDGSGLQAPDQAPAGDGGSGFGSGIGAGNGMGGGYGGGLVVNSGGS